jgi:hypothetical protein
MTTLDNCVTTSPEKKWRSLSIMLFDNISRSLFVWYRFLIRANPFRRVCLFLQFCKK